jgi:single-strand DNA-binding protein
MLNRFTCSGRLTADPELKQTPTNVSVATFNVAVERDFSDKNTGKRPVDFIPCVAWRQTGDFISRYFHKGDMITIDGRLETRRYQDKSGQHRTAYEIIVESAYFCGGSSNTTSTPQQTAATAQPRAQHPQAQQALQQNTSFNIGDFGDFEDMDDEYGLPF